MYNYNTPMYGLPQQNFTNYGLPQQNLNFQRQEVVRVNGENGAKAYTMPPNSSVLLLDESAPIVWLKTTDGASYPTITGYTITPIKEEVIAKTEKTDSYSDLMERINKLEKEVEELRDAKSDVGKTYQSKSNKSSVQ